MDRFAKILAWLLERSRPQFHPAVVAAWQVVVWFTVMGAVLTPLLWVINLFGDEKYSVNFEVLGVFGSLATVSELVRGHVKVWLGSGPDEWNFTAIGLAGVAAGVVFSVARAVQGETGVRTARGGWWAATQVRDILRRAPQR